MPGDEQQHQRPLTLKAGTIKAALCGQTRDLGSCRHGFPWAPASPGCAWLRPPRPDVAFFHFIPWGHPALAICVLLGALAQLASARAAGCCRVPSASQRVPYSASAGMVWAQNAQSMLQHQALVMLPVMSELHSICSRLWHAHHPAHANAALPQALQRPEMWLLLVALCLAQGLGGAVPHAGVSHGNPERFMNIVSVRGGKHIPMGPGLPQAVCPKSFPRDQMGCPHPLPWRLRLGSAGSGGLGAPRASSICMGVTHFMTSAWSSSNVDGPSGLVSAGRGDTREGGWQEWVLLGQVWGDGHQWVTLSLWTAVPAEPEDPFPRVSQ